MFQLYKDIIRPQ